MQEPQLQRWQSLWHAHCMDVAKALHMPSALHASLFICVSCLASLGALQRKVPICTEQNRPICHSAAVTFTSVHGA